MGSAITRQSIPVRFALTIIAGLVTGAALFILLDHDRWFPASPLGRAVRLVVLVPVAIAWRAVGWNLVSLAEDAAAGVAGPVAQSAVRIGVYLLLAIIFVGILFAVGRLVHAV